MTRTTRLVRNWVAVCGFLFVVGTAAVAEAYTFYLEAEYSTEAECLYASNAETLCRAVCASHSEPYHGIWCPYDPIGHEWMRECECGFPD